MGTQFTSRLKDSDRKRIYDGIVGSLFDEISVPIPPARPKVPKAGKVKGAEPTAPAKRPKKAAVIAETVNALSSTQRRRLGEAAVAQVLNVAAGHGFFKDFKESKVFTDLLDLLLRWRGDAEFNNFNAIVREYRLEESDNPSRDLARNLEEVANKNRTDPFRVFSTNAAKAIQVETWLRALQRENNKDEARAFGKELATSHVRDVVTLYIQRFVYEVLSKSLNMSGQAGGTIVEKTATAEAQKTTERIARNTVAQIEKEGALHNSKRIQEIVNAALMEYIEPKTSK